MERQTAGIPSYINECEHGNSNHASHGHRRRDVLWVCWSIIKNTTGLSSGQCGNPQELTDQQVSVSELFEI